MDPPVTDTPLVLHDEPPAYDDRLVAFVDILGWSKLIQDSIGDASLLKSLADAAALISKASLMAPEINAFYDTFGVDPVCDLRASHFSDTHVISVRATAYGAGLLAVVTVGLCNSFLDAGHYTRGAMVRGLVRHTDSALYGPAILDAHQLESDVAKYPRILVAPSAQALFESATWLRTDFDGLVHLRILWPSSVMFPEVIERHIARFRKFEKTYSLKLEAAGSNQNIAAKHGWFLGYLRASLAEAEAQRPA